MCACARTDELRKLPTDANNMLPCTGVFIFSDAFDAVNVKHWSLFIQRLTHIWFEAEGDKAQTGITMTQLGEVLTEVLDCSGKSSTARKNDLHKSHNTYSFFIIAY